LAWDELERSRDPKVLVEKSTFTVTKRFFGYGTEGKTKWEKRVKEYLHVVHTNRTKIPDMPKIKGTIAFHEGAGERDPNTDDKSKWKLLSHACRVLACRDGIPEPCN
jgi:hypothetical protein